MKKLLLSLALLCAFTSIGYSQAQDAEGCKDHPMFNRLPNFVIAECQQNYNSVTFQVGKSKKTEDIEGTVTRITYSFNYESGGKLPSALQIVKNYENAIVSKGGKKIYSGVDDVEGGEMAGTYSMTSEGKDYMVTVRSFYAPQTTGEIGAFNLIVLEKEAMKQDISAAAIFDELNKSGSVALYINFETGKSEIKSDSHKIVDEIAGMLKSNPSLKVSIEGHTDNVGKAPANKKLSENRANAIMKALIEEDINKSRLSAKGWGQEKPVADNATEEGRAKNRRVEIVKVQ